MKVTHCCSTQSAPFESQVVVERVQPFPKSGLIAENLNTPLPLIARRFGDLQARTYSYIVRTVRLNADTLRVEQRGSAPNFQGRILTLCTCKHQMRASQSTDAWENNVWIAGFSSRTLFDGKHWLVYLAKIQSAHEAHSDVRKQLSPHARKAKASNVHYLGDVYRPKTPEPKGDARYYPNRYFTPSEHVHHRKPGDNHWKNDVCYRHAGKYGHPALLIADPRLTFLWEQPSIYFSHKHCRNYLKWTSLQSLIGELRAARR